LRRKIQLLEGRMRNVPKAKGKRKRAATAEEDRLRQILLALINEFVMPVNPERAGELISGRQGIAGQPDRQDKSLRLCPVRSVVRAALSCLRWEGRGATAG
jgi:hypothetical protein